LRRLYVVGSVPEGTDIDVGLLNFGNHVSATSLDHSGDYSPKLRADTEILAEFHVLSSKCFDRARWFEMGGRHWRYGIAQRIRACGVTDLLARSRSGNWGGVNLV
jgi:hypothetical protein